MRGIICYVHEMDDGQEQTNKSGVVSYKADYRPRGKNDAVTHRLTIGEYATLNDLCVAHGITLSFGVEGLKAVESMIAKRGQIEASLASELGVYLADVLSVTLPDAKWEVNGYQRPVIVIGELKRWDVIDYVERVANTRMDVLSAGLDYGRSFAEQ